MVACADFSVRPICRAGPANEALRWADVIVASSEGERSPVALMSALVAVTRSAESSPDTVT
jgi:hypothetical protein